MQHADVSAVGNDHIHVGTGGNFSCDHLGIHAAGTYITAGGSLAHIHEFIRKFIHLFDKFCIRILSGIIGIESVDIRQQDQQVRIDQGCHDCGQRIIITNFNLVGSYGIIFIHNGYHPHF